MSTHCPALSFKRTITCLAVLAAAILATAPAASAATCGKSGAGFERWIADYKNRARADGISARTIRSALDGVTYDSRVIRRDRSQRSFKLSLRAP